MEEQEPYTKVYTSFGADDMVASFDGKIMGELQDIRWEKHLSKLSGPSVEGIMTFTVFAEDPVEELEGKYFSILLRYMNEHGQRRLEYIKDVKLVSRKSGIGIHDVSQAQQYTFSADDAGTIPWLETKTEMLKYLLKNYRAYRPEEKLRTLAYKDLLLLDADMGRLQLIE